MNSRLLGLFPIVALLAGCATTDPGPSPDLYQKQVEFQKSQVPGAHGSPGGERAAREKDKP